MAFVQLDSGVVYQTQDDVPPARDDDVDEQWEAHLRHVSLQDS